MIKIERVGRPETLTDELVSELTEKYKLTGDSVWRRADIISGLLASSHSKCAYCECRVQSEDSYFEVEHFRCKSIHLDDVVIWDNLLPSCKRCNVSKGDHDVTMDPILNPTVDDPRPHLYFQALYLRGKTIIGELTIDVVDLNNFDRLVKPRLEILNQVERSVRSCEEKLELFRREGNRRRLNQLLGSIKDLLAVCQRPSPFAALTSTFLQENSRYKLLRRNMTDVGLWDPELQALDQSSSDLALLNH